MLWMLTDSQSAITYQKGGPNAPLTTVGENIWKLMKDIKSHGTSINFQWVPGHRDIAGNEEADQAAGEANINTLPQKRSARRLCYNQSSPQKKNMGRVDRKRTLDTWHVQESCLCNGLGTFLREHFFPYGAG